MLNYTDLSLKKIAVFYGNSRTKYGRNVEQVGSKYGRNAAKKISLVSSTLRPTIAVLCPYFVRASPTLRAFRLHKLTKPETHT